MVKTNYTLMQDDSGVNRLEKLAKLTLPYSIDFLESSLSGNQLPLGRGLDLGCGTGVGTRILAEHCDQVLAVDQSDHYIELASKNARTSKSSCDIQFLCASISDVLSDESYQSSFDVIYSRYVMAHLPEASSLLNQIRALLKPGGKLLVEDFDVSKRTFAPANDSITRFMDFYDRLLAARSSDGSIGGKLEKLMVENGFDQVRSNEVVPMSKDPTRTAELTASTLEECGVAMLEEGIASKEEITSTASGIRSFAQQPGITISSSHIFQVEGLKQ